MALPGALCQTLLAATGFTNKRLRALIAGLLGSDYRSGQMTYDLRRLRLAGLIRRVDHPGGGRTPSLAVLGAYQQLFGLELEHLAVDGCITKAPAAGRSPGRARWIVATRV
jgi:hypothetical protein